MIRLYSVQTNATALIQAYLAVSPLPAEMLALARECGEEKLMLQPSVQAQLDSILQRD